MEENKAKEYEEAILTERRSLVYKASDDDLIRAIDTAVKESITLKQLADRIGKRNETYWEKGTDIKPGTIHPKKSKTIDNRIFMSTETLVPMVISRTPEPTIINSGDNDIREKLVRVLTCAYEVKQKLKIKVESVIRHWFLYHIGILKYRWDDGFITEVVRPEKMGFDPTSPDKGSCEFMYEWLEDTIGDLIEKFPKKKKDLIAKYGTDRMKSKVRYVEFWGGNGKWVAWKLQAILLGKQKNPNFDYGTDAVGKEGEEDFEEAIEGANNLFKFPEFPYLILNVFNLGKNIYDDTGLIEQAIPLQDAVNKRKNQISDLTDEQKKVIIASSKAMSKEELQKFIDKYGHIGLWLDKGEMADVRVEGGQAGADVFNDLSHSIGEIDNIMGTHSTSRGERKEQETLGGRKLLTSADFGRTETIVMNVEQLMEDWYNAYLHMIRVYSNEEMEFDDGEGDPIKLTRDDIPENVVIMVKKGSTLPVDKASRAEMAVKLAQFGFIDPSTLFQELGYSKEEERTEDLFKWLAATGKINPEAISAGAGAGAGQAEQGDQKQKQELVVLKQIMSSEEFKKLPLKKQKSTIAKAREIVKKIKEGK